MQDLTILEKKDIITSLELLEQINLFRKQEGNRAELQHYDLLKIIRDEFSEEIGLGKISESYYINSQNKKQPMFELTTAQAKQVLVRESKFVRKAVIHYIEELEKQLGEEKALPIKKKLLWNIIEADNEMNRAVAINDYEIKYVKPLENKVAELEPQAMYCKAMLISDGLVAISTIAKDLGFKSATELNKELHRVGVQYKTSKSSPWQLYSKYADKGYAKTIPQPNNTSKGFKTFPHLYWTEAGKKFIYELKQQGVIKTMTEKRNEVA